MCNCILTFCEARKSFLYSKDFASVPSLWRLVRGRRMPPRLKRDFFLFLFLFLLNVQHAHALLSTVTYGSFDSEFEMHSETLHFALHFNSRNK